jgi:chorismate synthase
VDLRPVLERASARETAARVAAGAVCRGLLAQFDILVGGYVSAIAEVDAELTSLDYPARISAAKNNLVHCPDPASAEKMEAAIQKALRAGETLGGMIEVVALGVPPGLGSYTQWDRRLDGRLGAALLSIPAIKGVEIGPAFENTRLAGTQVTDPILLEGDNLDRGSDRSGGIEGGVSTGQPILLRMAMKPIPTTLKRQPSVDLAAGKALDTVYERSDFCPVPRAVVVCEAMTLFVLADALLEKLGGDSLDEIRPRFASLRRAKLSDLKIDGQAHGFWPVAKEGE